ncbi:MAG: hypothetical protein IJO32_07955, partial [Bacilli bacterium]|nr:hypothetical protein [Bacilli bacterium]
GPFYKNFAKVPKIIKIGMGILPPPLPLPNRRQKIIAVSLKIKLKYVVLGDKKFKILSLKINKKK